jgi:hypothetical protein
MLTQTAMFVVFVLDEFISQGSSGELTAGEVPKSLWIWNSILESATVTMLKWKHFRWNEVNPTSEQPKLW